MVDRHIVCLKWGTRYSSDYVNRLHSMVERNMTGAYQFHCLTDDQAGIDKAVNILPIPENERQIPGWWQKLAIFKSNFYDLEGDLLFIDLDMVILDNISDFFAFEEGDFCVVDKFFKCGNISSCVMRLRIGSLGGLWESFLNDKDNIMYKYGRRGDQEFIFHNVDSMKLWPKDFVINYKKACKHRLPWWQRILPQKWALRTSKIFKTYTKKPKTGKILAFQNKPDIHEILEEASGKYRASPWLKAYWQ